MGIVAVVFNPTVMNSEKFSLKWNDFQTNISKSFSELRKEEDFFDVTLISDDESKLSAHKVVLASCSSFFKSILRATTTSNPIIYLSGVTSQNLGFMLDYMYQGEVEIFQEDLDDFLTVAQKLKIQGLISDSSTTQNTKEALDQDLSSPEQNKGQRKTLVKMESEERNATLSDTENAKSKSEMQITSLNGSLTVQNTSELDNAVEDLIVEENGIVKCKVCGKTSTATTKCNMRQNLKKHVEIHIEGLSFDCQHCDKSFRSRESLRKHKHRTHNN